MPPSVSRTGGCHRRKFLQSAARIYFVDIGRAHLQAGQYDRAVGALRVAREIAPQCIRVHPDVRHVLFTLLEIGVTEIAEWARVSLES